MQANEDACEASHASLPTADTYTHLLEARRKLALHFSELAQTSSVRRAKSLFDQGNKNGKLLAFLVADQRAQTNIPCIRRLQGALTTDPSDNMATFVKYYSTLYAPIPTYSKVELE